MLLCMLRSICSLFQTDSLLGFLNEQGVRDGLSGRMDKSVDGLPLSYHLQMVEKIVSMTMQY